jgi:hypothetical protein
VNHWLQLLVQLGPIILAATPLAPLTNDVVTGMAAAEGLPGATGPQKKSLVQTIVRAAAHGANTQAGRTIIDPALASDSAGHIIDTIVNITNIVHQAQEDSAPVAPDTPHVQ